MAIKVITGIPGSGKSYYAVSHIVKNHFDFDPEYWDYKPKDENLLVVTNMAGLKIPHLSLQDASKEVGASSIYDLLRIPNIPNQTESFCITQSKIWELKEKFKAKLLFIFDEVQRIFPYKYNDDEILFFFQYHRHLGTDIYCLGQDWKSICPKITSLSEFEIRAIPKSKQLVNELRYHVYLGFEKVGSFKLTPDKKIFTLYKSFEEKEFKGKETRPVRKFLATTLLLAVVSVSFTLYWLNNFGQTNQKEAGKGGSVGPSPTASPPAAPPIRKPNQYQPGPQPNKGKVIHQKTEVEEASKESGPVYSIVNAGGMWRGDELAYIQIEGKLYPVKTFPYEWLPADPHDGVVQVLMPDIKYRLK